MSSILSYPPLHTFIYGQMGTYKSTGAASFPKPMVVWMCDAVGKDLPYLYDYYNDGQERGEIGPIVTEATHYWREVRSKKDNRLLIRVHYFYEDDDFEEKVVQLNQKAPSVLTLVPKPTLARRFLSYFAQCKSEIDEIKNEHGTLVLDGFDSLEYAFREYHKWVLNPQAIGEGKQQWWSGSTDDSEMVMMRLRKWYMNVVITAHVDADKDKEGGGVIKYRPNMPGRLPANIGRDFGEYYHAYTDKEGDGLWQTRASDRYDAGTLIGAPNPVGPHYKLLWKNFKGGIVKPTEDEKLQEQTGEES